MLLDVRLGRFGQSVVRTPTQDLHLPRLALSRTQSGSDHGVLAPASSRSCELANIAILSWVVFYYKKILLLYCSASKICLSSTLLLTLKSAIVLDTFKILKYALADNCKPSIALVKIFLLLCDK